MSPISPSPARTSRSRGVSATEILISVGILLALAGVVAPSTHRSPAEKAERIVRLTRDLERAVLRHYVDVRACATEFSTHDGAVEAYHELFHDRGHPRYAGPYLERPLSPSDNPCGGDVFVYPTLRGGVASPGGGFDPEGRGFDRVKVRGQFVAFTDVPEDVARRVDAAIDGESPGGAWRGMGRVEYSLEQRHLMILLLEL